MWIVKKKLGLE